MTTHAVTYTKDQAVNYLEDVLAQRARLPQLGEVREYAIPYSYDKFYLLALPGLLNDGGPADEFLAVTVYRNEDGTYPQWVLDPFIEAAYDLPLHSAWYAKQVKQYWDRYGNQGLGVYQNWIQWDRNPVTGQPVVTDWLRQKGQPKQREV